MGDKAAVEDGLRQGADAVVAIAIENNRLITNFMETRGVIAEYDAQAESFTLTISQPGRPRPARHAREQGPEGRRRRRSGSSRGDVGGGFGTKSFMYREYPLAAEAARAPQAAR